jgi:hypothetical protein
LRLVLDRLRDLKLVGEPDMMLAYPPHGVETLAVTWDAPAEAEA